MTKIYQNIITAIAEGEKLLAVLIDPDKMLLEALPSFIKKLHTSVATHIFVGGSTVEDLVTDTLVDTLKKLTHLPVIIFPGDVTQITDKADALLFLSLISGTNPDYLIGKHIASVAKLRTTNLQVISTGYLLIENGKETAVQRVTQTQPMLENNVQHIVDTAKAGELLGMKLIYLEAGSGAVKPVSADIISGVKKDIQVPLIVGGGIKNIKDLKKAYKAGADLVVIGTAFEDDDSFFEELKY
ncbi:geranylgeranylglyceryl/heptaprenylglyceryl phosphate synthase [Lacinutrix undariae]